MLRLMPIAGANQVGNNRNQASKIPIWTVDTYVFLAEDILDFLID
jgi:hypothetical protein